MANGNAQPAFGCIRLSRVTGPKRQLFGSDIEHEHTITLTIHNAKTDRTCGTTYIMPEKELIRVEMSQTQFAAMLTSIGQGEDLPCTIKEFDGKCIPTPVFENKTELHVTEFAEHQKEISETIAFMQTRINALMEKKSLTKTDREEIRNMMKRLNTEVNNNTAFMIKSFDNYIDNRIHDAKGEIEAYIHTKLNNIAMTAIAENMNAAAAIETKGEETNEDH